MEAFYPSDPIFLHFLCIWNHHKGKDGYGIYLTLYSKFDGFSVKGKRLCVPMSCWKNLCVKEAYHGSLKGHFGIDNTLDILEEQFYFPKMHIDMAQICCQCF